MSYFISCSPLLLYVRFNLFDLCQSITYLEKVKIKIAFHIQSTLSYPRPQKENILVTKHTSSWRAVVQH